MGAEFFAQLGERHLRREPARVLAIVSMDSRVLLQIR